MSWPTGAQPSGLRKTTSLPDFGNPVKSDLPTTASSPVRSVRSESVSSQSGSEIWLLKCLKRNRFTLKRKSKSWESIAVKKSSKNTAQNKWECKTSIKAKKKVKNFVSSISNSPFWTGSRPVLLPRSRPSRLRRLTVQFLEHTILDKTKKKGNNNLEKKEPEVTEPSHSSQIQPPKPIKKKTKHTFYSDSKNITTTTTTADDKGISERLSKEVEDKHESKQLKPKRLVSTEEASQRLSTDHDQEDRQCTRLVKRYLPDPPKIDYTCSEQAQVGIKGQSRRRLPDLIHLGLLPKQVTEQEKPIVQQRKLPNHVRNNSEPYRKYPVEPVEIPRLRHSSLESISLSDSNNGCTEDYMGRMGSLEDHERKIIIEFCHLLEKSKQLFNGLRELPQYGHKQWHFYFGRTFDVYAKLWKFQQQHRAVLDSKYGLKRWQIGEIASKIGQLYYHFYIRTSETAYLNEAFSFYSTIRGRSYYTRACKEDKCELMVKKLRYYTRFIVVCLLLKKVKLVRELMKELDKQIIEYGNTYDPADQMEWTDVVDDVKAFIQAEAVVSVIHPDNYSIVLSHRLKPLTIPPVERSSQMNLSLQEVLIVGSSSQQVKFSELTMDMFRMLQTLEKEPTGEIQHLYDDSPRQGFNLTPSALNNIGYDFEMLSPRSENPHKYLLYKPSPSQILVYLASGCNDLPPNGALLLYISADGHIVQSSKHPEDGYDIGGLTTTSKNDLYRNSKEKGSQFKNKEVQCLHPGDLYPFTRQPLFIVVDSDNSYVFQSIPRHFGQPLVILMSPLELPSSLHGDLYPFTRQPLFIVVDSDNSYVFQSIPRHFGQPLLILMSPLELPSSLHVSNSDRRQQGSLFTLFLHSPLTAFCHCCDIHTIHLEQWDRAQAYIDTFLTEASQITTRNRIDVLFLNFMGDDFLRVLILRFIFCEVVLRMHRAFRARTHRTRSSPPIPDDILEHPALTHIVMDLASHLQVREDFHDPSTFAGPAPTVKE